jgi:hypothetical protein
MPVGDFTRVCMHANCCMNHNGECLPCGIGPLGQGYIPPQQGCVCPPTSEQTCGNPTCPRKPQK